MTTFAFAHFETSSKFYNASNVAIPLQDVLEARAFSEIAADADLLRGETLGLREHLRRQAPGNHDDAVGVREHEVARVHYHALRRRAGHADAPLPRRHFPPAERLHGRPVTCVNGEALLFNPLDVADAAVDER